MSLVVALLFVSSLFIRCASIESPTGGPKDTLPPVIMVMTPDNFTKNMDTLAKRIYIEFNEFVQLTDQQTQFFTSPQMKNKPQLAIKGRGVVVTMRDTLRPNTTYALNFGSAIRDNNEGNPLYSARYVFSTGDEIDSLIMSGYAEDSYKMDSVGGTYIFLYPKDSVKFNARYDSTLFNSTPAVIARSENNGIFMAQNLKPIPYYIYAMEDTNGNMTYEPGVDRVGFINGTRNPKDLGDFSIWYDSLRKYVVAEPQLHFRMFLDEAFKRQLLQETSRPLQHKAVLNFGANHPRIDSLILDSIPSDRIIWEYQTAGRDTISLWFDMPAEQIPDSIRGRIVYYKHDSLSNLTLTTEPLKLNWRYIETKQMQQAREKEEKARKRAEDRGEEYKEPEVENKFSLKIGSEESVNPEKSISFELEYPLSKLDRKAITLTRLTVEEQKILEEQKQIAADAARLAAAEAALAAAEAKAAGTATTETATTGATAATGATGATTANTTGATDTTEAAATAATTAAPERQYYGEPHPFKFERDTQNLRLYHFSTEWGEPGDLYYLTLNKGAMTDVAGLSNDSITKKFTPIRSEDYSRIVVNIVGDPKSKTHYVLELLDGAGTQIKEQKTGVQVGKTVFNYLPAGAYSLRVIEDLNNNGKWDGGNLIKRKQSEKAQTYRSAKGVREIETKVNWEIEIDVDPKTMFAAESQEELTRRLDKQEQYRLEEIERKELEKLK